MSTGETRIEPQRLAEVALRRLEVAEFLQHGTQAAVRRGQAGPQLHGALVERQRLLELALLVPDPAQAAYASA